ncbi:MAG: N-acetylmuramoyl-L-alanine amidase [Zetaproteobacteria bacterium CG1_02_53_45]|nr:MAG: N-acetylmuramoyl-L-alanine amidase [Zetaproteobacteria bacterium CG1_02_53_45]
MRQNLFFSKIVGLLLLLLFSSAAQADTGALRDIRLWTAPDHTRLVLDLSGKIEYELFRLHNPERIVIDMQQTELKTRLNQLSLPDPVIQEIRSGVPKTGMLRLVIDVKEKVQPRSFLLKPMQGKPFRLVVDLMRPDQAKKEAITADVSKKQKELIIAIDAGHGGEDPGAIGPHKLYEKVVTLAVAKELAKIVDATPGMKAVLIREGDYFVPLMKRVQLARKAKADLMISIHADAVRTHTVEGASVYTLSDRGATEDKAARALAAKENAADEVGGVAFDQIDDPVVNSILGKMLRTDSINSSHMLAETVISKMKHAGPIKYSSPKRARFAVLSAMEIPSVLVELDYISNPARERMLKTREHQKLLASALFDASVDFFHKMGRLKDSTASAVASDDTMSLFAGN